MRANYRETRAKRTPRGSSTSLSSLYKPAYPPLRFSSIPFPIPDSTIPPLLTNSPESVIQPSSLAGRISFPISHFPFSVFRFPIPTLVSNSLSLVLLTLTELLVFLTTRVLILDPEFEVLSLFEFEFRCLSSSDTGLSMSSRWSEILCFVS